MNERGAGNSHILVTGSNRSGTTWVGETLRLSGLNYFYEPFGRRADRLKVACPFSHHFHFVTENERAAAKEYLDCCLSPLNLSWRKEVRLSPSVRGVAAASYHQFRQLLGLVNFEQRFIIKDPLALFSAPWMYQAYGCKVIVMIRHPCAYVASIKRVGWRSDPRALLDQPELMKYRLSSFKSEIEKFVPTENNLIEEATLRWRIYHHVIGQYQLEYPWIFKLHENLSADPSREYERLFAELDLPFSEHARLAIQNSNSLLDSPDLGQSVHVLKRNSRANIKMWKTALTSSEIDYVREEAGAISAQFYGESSWR